MGELLLEVCKVPLWAKSFLFSWVPIGKKGGAMITASGYDRIQLMRPPRSWGAQTDLHILRCRSAEDVDDVHRAVADNAERLGINKPNPPFTFVDSSDLEYFSSLTATPAALAAIRKHLEKGALFRPYCWDALMEDFIRRAEIPADCCYNRAGFMDRLNVESSPDDIIIDAQVPQDMVFTRDMVCGAVEARDVVRQWRENGYTGQILLDLENSPGGTASALLEEGTATENPRVIAFLRENPGANILITQPQEDEIEFSVQLEYGPGGEARFYGLNRKLYVRFEGRRMKGASAMGLDRLDGIPESVLELAVEWSTKIASNIYAKRGYIGAMGVVWRLLPGKSWPMLFRINFRDDSEIPLTKILEWLWDLTRQRLVGQHTRIYFREHRWGDVVRLLGHRSLGDLMFRPERGRGAFIHVPYDDIKWAGCKTLLLMNVASTQSQLDEDTLAVKKRLGAWFPGEEPPAR